MTRLLPYVALVFLVSCGDSDSDLGDDVEAGDGYGVSASSQADLGAGAPSVRELSSGVVVNTTVVGRGPSAQIGDRVVVHYEGRIAESGEVIDSTHPSGIPKAVTLGAGEVIRGLDVGLVGAREGAAIELAIPAVMAYGEEGLGRVPPDADLEFDVRVVKVERDE